MASTESNIPIYTISTSMLIHRKKCIIMANEDFNHKDKVYIKCCGKYLGVLNHKGDLYFAFLDEKSPVYISKSDKGINIEAPYNGILHSPILTKQLYWSSWFGYNKYLIAMPGIIGEYFNIYKHLINNDNIYFIKSTTNGNYLQSDFSCWAKCDNKNTNKWEKMTISKE